MKRHIMDEKEIERLAERLLNGTATEEERRLLNTWYESKNDDSVIVPALFEGEKKSTEEKIWSKLNSMLEEDVTKHTTKPSWQRNGVAHYISIAALILVVLSLSFVIYMNSIQFEVTEEPLTLVEKSTKSGEKREIQLPDGTRVYLNSESSLIFPDHFTGNSRTVMLKGEAFFDVVKDEKRPFTVTSQNLLITVLGTSFNVMAYPEEDEKQVWVNTGTVRVENNKNGESEMEINSVLLVPNEGVVYNTKTTSFEKREMNIDDKIAWKDGWLIFEKTELQEVIGSLERWYGVEIEIYNEELKKKKVTLKQQDESLESVMKVLGFLAGFEFSIKDKHVTIKK